MRKTSLPRWSTWTLAVSCSLISRETLVPWWMNTSRELWAKPVASVQTLPFPRARQGWILCGEVRGAGTRSLWRGLLGLHCSNTHWLHCSWNSASLEVELEKSPSNLQELRGSLDWVIWGVKGGESSQRHGRSRHLPLLPYPVCARAGVGGGRAHVDSQMSAARLEAFFF